MAAKVGRCLWDVGAGWQSLGLLGETLQTEADNLPSRHSRSQLFLHANLIPQEIYKYVPGDAPLQPVNPNPPQHNCLTELTRAQRDHAKFHHATPLLRATLCRRGECTPDIHNTVLFGIIHIKYMKVSGPVWLPTRRFGSLELADQPLRATLSSLARRSRGCFTSGGW